MLKIKIFEKAMSKSEIAEAAGMSISLLRRELNNEPLRTTLKKLGYKNHQKVLLPKQVKCICKHLGIYEDYDDREKNENLAS